MYKKNVEKFHAIFYIFYINCHQTIKKIGETERERLNIESEQVNKMWMARTKYTNKKEI